jgi:hypothetical protein
MATQIPAKKNAIYITYISLTQQADVKKFQVNPTLDTGDVKVSTDGATEGNITTLPVVTPAGSTRVKVTLSASEMNGDNIQVSFIDAAGAQWADKMINIPTSSKQIDDLALASVCTEARLAELDLGNLPTDIAAIPTTKTGYSLSVAGILAIWHQALSAIVTAGSIGKLIKDNLDAVLSNIAARLPAALVSGRMDSNISAINDNTVAAVNLASSTGAGLVEGTIVAGFAPTLTQFKTDLPSSKDNFYKDHLLYFIDGSEVGQIFEVTAYVGATKIITITASTGIPVIGDKFILG